MLHRVSSCVHEDVGTPRLGQTWLRDVWGRVLWDQGLGVLY